MMAKRKSVGLKKRLLFSLVPLVLILGLAEGALWLVGYRSPIEDPFASFVAQEPLFVEDSGQLSISPTRTLFHPASFPVKKPAGEVRIFVVGGSTTYGFKLPNPERDSYGGQLEGILKRRLGVPVRVINCGANAYASYRLTKVVEDIMDCSPDLVFIMSGHNEFLEPIQYADLMEGRKEPWYLRLRLVVAARTLRDAARPVFDLEAVREPVVDQEPFKKYIVRSDEDYDLALNHYRHNLTKMIEAGASKNVPVVLSTTTCNIRDFAPFYSESDDFSSIIVKSKVKELQQLLDEDQFELVLSEVENLLKRDDKVAVFHFLAAKALDGLNRFDEARDHYVKAKDNDRFPHRALTTFNAAIIEIASQQSVKLLDADTLIREAAQNQIPGADMFVDHCHPTAAAHKLIAEALADEIEPLLTD